MRRRRCAQKALKASDANCRGIRMTPVGTDGVAKRGTEDAKRAPQTTLEDDERRRACGRLWLTATGNWQAKLLTRVFSAGGRALTVSGAKGGV